MKILNNDTIKLCRQGSCCMTVRKTEEGNYEFFDDYASTIVLSKHEVDNVVFNAVEDGKYRVYDSSNNFVTFNADEKDIFNEGIKYLSK